MNRPTCILTTDPPSCGVWDKYQRVPNEYHTCKLIVRLYATQYGLVAAGAISASLIANVASAVVLFGVAYFLLHFVVHLPWPWIFNSDEPARNRFWRRVGDSFISTLLLFGSLMLSTIPDTWATDPIPQRMGNIIFLGGYIVLIVLAAVPLTTAGRIIWPKHRLKSGDDTFDYLEPR